MGKRGASGRAETALGAPKAWRDAARAALDAQPRGAYARCAAAVGCKPPTLTQLLNGAIAVSPLVPKVSDHLGIPRPGEMKRVNGELELAEQYRLLDEDDRRLASDFIRRLASKPKNDG